MYDELRLRKQTREELVKRFDASETAFLERELTVIRRKVFEVQYADLLAKKFMPLATDIPPSAETYVYGVYDKSGRAKVIANGSVDLPRVDVIKSEVTGKVREIGDSYGWDITSMREAARVGAPLTEMKAKAARTAIETLTDKMLFDGKDHDGTSFGVTGIANNADVISQGIVNPVSDPWLITMDPALILADLNSSVATMVAASLQKWLPDTLLLAPREFAIIVATRVSVYSDATILQSFLKTNPYIKNIDQWHRLTGAGAGGLNRGIAYKRDPEVLEGVVPLDFEQLPPQARGLEFVVPCHARCGGVKVYQPGAMRYIDFATS
jgi:hypothetical protein